MAFINDNILDMKMVSKVLANNVMILRSDRGLSQKELGDMLGMHQSSIARIEAGLHAPLKVTLGALAKAFNVSMEELLNDDILKKEQQAKVTAVDAAQKRTEELLMNIGGLKFNIVALENQIKNLTFQLEAKDLKIEALTLELEKLKKKTT